MAKETPGAGDGEGKETVLDAINAALGEGAGEATPTDDEAGDAGAEEPGVEAGEAEGAEDEGAAADGAETKPDGTDAKVGSEGKDGKPLAKDEKAAADAAAKKPDPVNDPIPKELAQETQTRIRSLIKMSKDATAARDQIQQNHDFIVEGLRATGTTPEQYGEVLSWLSLFNSNDPAQQEKALELVESVADRLATLLGRERSLNDPLAGHADLQQAVQQGQMTAAWAKQLAVQRNQSKFKGDIEGGRRQAVTTQQQQQRDMDQARADLNAIETRLKSDPRFLEKRAIIVPILKKQFKRIPPKEWGQAFQDAYDEVKLPPRQTRTGTPGGVPNQQPLRARQGTGGAGTSKAPSSALEAMNTALAGISK